MKRWKENIHGIGPLDYITFKDVPMRESKWGPVIELNLKIMEEAAARALIIKRLPLRGREVLFLRKTIGLSMAAFSEKLGLTTGSVQKWEKAKDVRLHPINELAVRSLLAEVLDVDISGKFSQMIGIEKTPKHLDVVTE